MRTVPAQTYGSTKVVDEQTGRVVAEDRLELFPGIGVVGVELSYEDFRAVDGMCLPFRIVVKYATPLLGEFVVAYDAVETSVAAESAFPELAAAGDR